MDIMRTLMKKSAVCLAVVFAIYFVMELLRTKNLISGLNSIYLYYEVAFLVIIGLFGIIAVVFGICMVLNYARKPAVEKAAKGKRR
jgi:hypothetical protein